MTTLADARLIDIHTHYRPPGWQAPGGERPRPVAGFPKELLENLPGLARESVDGGVDLRALSAPVEQLFGLDGPVETAAVNSVNEFLAEAVRERPDVFLGLATVDAFSGDAGAEQTRYAIEELGLHGIVLDSSRDERFLSSSEAFPTLELAAALGVPVFVHPVAAPQAEALVKAAGRPGNSIGRGLQNGVGFLSALHADLPARLPDLHLVFTALGSGALYFATEELAAYRRKSADGAPANIYFDTTRLNPWLIRYYADVLGVDRIIVGSDWPGRPLSAELVGDALDTAGFDAATQERIRAGNARRLFELRAAKTVEAA
ncbi:amidohydrolase family protein [Microbispora sp. H10949]|uniref:amidohydrolase family protein n=1 Tax=Microbispora sp. H10949 TaxID=2729111 RepID=UPI0016010671|nr:amidohydrolase family protein [Microbispora sp. H10949]